jgi:hypothetical protein
MLVSLSGARLVHDACHAISPVVGAGGRASVYVIETAKDGGSCHMQDFLSQQQARLGEFAISI